MTTNKILVIRLRDSKPTKQDIQMVKNIKERNKDNKQTYCLYAYKTLNQQHKTAKDV